MSQSKSAAATKRGTKPKPNYLGVKIQDGQSIKTGQIIVRQRGMKIKAGDNVGVGKDHTLFALENGTVKFNTTKKTNYDGNKKEVKVVSIISS